MNSDLYTYLSLSIFFIILNSVVIFYKRDSLSIFTLYISLMFILSVYLLDKIKNYIYYYLFILVTALFSFMFIIYYFNFNTVSNINISIKIELLLLFFLSIIIFTSLSRSVVFLKFSNENEPHRGEEGYKGTKGLKGKTIPVHNNLYIYNSMINYTNKIIHNYKMNEILGDEDYVNDYLKNNYMKDNFKRISESYNIIYNEPEEIMSKFDTIKPVIKKWIEHILNYQQGFNFLTDSEQDDKDWKHLLSKNKSLNETISPFEMIKKDEIWNW